MIFYLLYGILLVIYVVGTILTFMHRKEEFIKCRHLFLTAASNFSLMVLTTFLTVGLEFFYFTKGDIWKEYCVPLISLPLAAAIPAIGWLALLVAFNAQFQYFRSLSNLKNQKVEFYAKYRRFTETKTISIFLSIVSTIFLIPPIATYYLYRQPINTMADCFYPYLIIYTVQVFPMMALFAYLFFKFLQFKDPFGIKRQLLVVLILGTGVTTPFLILQYLEYLPEEYHPVKFQPILLILIFGYLYCPVTIWYPLFLTWREKRRRRANVNHDSIKHILENSAAAERFSYFVAQHWCSEAFMFAMDVNQFKKIPDSDYSRLKKESKTICDKYLDPHSHLLINIDAAISKEILAIVKSGNVHKEVFLKAERDIHAQLEGILQRWKETDSYQSMINSFKEDLSVDHTLQLSTR